MPRSTRDSDEDAESKIGRRTRTLTQAMIDSSSVRRSSRIRQSVKQNKSPPESPGSDTSNVSNSQPIRSTRQRTGIMDTTVTEAPKGRHRKNSVSSDISEMADIDVVGTPKRTTRRSLAASISGTPTKANTRAASKRLTRAGSETKSPPPVVRTTRRTRASSMDPENMSDPSKSQPSTPSKVRRRASMLLSPSLVKQKMEEINSIPYVLLDATLVEVDEAASLDSSPDKVSHSQQSKKMVEKRKSVNEDKDVEDSSNDKKASSILLTSNEASQEQSLSENKDNGNVITTTNKSLGEEQSSSKENLLHDADTTVDDVDTCDTRSLNCEKENKAETAENEENMTEIEQPLIKICMKSPATKLGIKIENILNASIEEQKRNPDKKEERIVNVISDTLIERGIAPIISGMTSLDTKHLTSAFENKPLSGKEIKSVINDTNFNKRRQSRGSTDATVKFVLSKEIGDSVEEKMDISTDSLSPGVIHKKKSLDGSLLDDTKKRQSLVLDVESELTTMNDINKSVLSQDDTIEVVNKIIAENKMSVESINESNENATDVTSKSDKIDKTSHTIIDSETSNKITLNETDEISCSSMNKSKTNEISDDQKSLNPLTTDDNGEMKVILEEQNTCRYNESLHNSAKMSHSNSDISDVQIDVETLSLEIPSDEFIISNKQSATAQDEAKDLLDSTKETENNLSDHVMELQSESCNTETVNPVSNSSNADDTVNQDMQSSHLIETSKESILNVSPNKAESKNTLLKTAVMTKQESADTNANLEIKETILQSEESYKDSKNTKIADSDSDVDIDNLFQDIPAAEWKEKIVKKDNEIEKSPAQSDSHSMEKLENESEAECDLVLVDKQAWLNAENIKTAKEKECFDYDSDDTVLLKSRLDAMQDSEDVKKLDTVKEDLAMDIDSEEDEADKPVKIRKSLIKRRSTSRKDKNSSNGCLQKDTDDSSPAAKSLNKSKTVLDRDSNQIVIRSNKSGQVTKAAERSSRIYDESDKEIEDDADGLNRSSLMSMKTTSLQESKEKRKSLNRSSKDTSSKQTDQSLQNVSANKSGIDDLEEETNNTDIHNSGEKLNKRKQSLNKSMRNKDADHNIIESENRESLLSNEDSNKKEESAFLIRSMDKKLKSTDSGTSMQLNADSSDGSGDSEVFIRAKDFKFKKSKKKHSTIVSAGSSSNDSDSHNSSNDDWSDTSNENGSPRIPRFLFAHCDSNDDSDSIDADVKREYNLNGAEEKFPDDDIPGDECRASESEYSDSDDNGSDLADFVVDDDDDDVEDEEEEEKNDEEGDEQDVEEDEKAEEEGIEDAHEEEQLIEKYVKVAEEEEEDDDEQVEDIKEENIICAEEITDKKESPDIRKSKNISSRHIVPRISQTKKDEGVEANKSHTKENEKTILLDTSNLTSSNKKKKKKLDVQYSSKDVTEQDSMEQPHECKTRFERKLHELHASMECSTPKVNSFKQKFEIDVETPITASETEDKMSSSKKETMQFGSLKKKKTRKDSILKENISLKEYDNTNKINRERTLLHSSLPSDLLEAVGKTSILKSSKMAALHKTMNVTHTETPTIRYLRKEKLNETAPALKLGSETSQLKGKIVSGEEEDDVAQTDVKKEDSDKELPNLVMLSNYDNTQNPSQRKQKRRKKRAEKTPNEDTTDKSLSQDAVEPNVLKKKKKKKKTQSKLSEVPTVKSDIHENTCQINEKKRKRQIDVTEENENVNENNVLQKDIRGNKMKLRQHDKKVKSKIETGLENDTSSADNYKIVKKKVKRQHMEERKETSEEGKETLEKLPKKKKKNKEEKALSSKTGASKSKSESSKIAESKKLRLRNIVSDTGESKNAAFAKARNEALEAIKRATERISNFKNLRKPNKDLKRKKTREDAETKIQEQDTKIPIKQKKRERDVEKQKMLPSSTCSLKRLPDDVIENLSDVPMRAKKKRKLLPNAEQIVPSSSSLKNSSSRFVESKVKDTNFIPLSSCGGTTQFTVINLQKAKKQQPTMAASTSFKQRMLARNNRYPVTSYLMYLQKRRATSNDGFSKNMF